MNFSNILESKKYGSYAIFNQKDSLLNYLESVKYCEDIEISIFCVQNLSIENSLEIRKRVITKQDKTRVVAIVFFTATTESQNALLKTLEDGAHKTIFIVCTGSRNFIIETVLSRLVVLDSVVGSGYSQTSSVNKYVEDFLRSKKTKRLELSFLKKIFDDKKNPVDREFLHSFLLNCISKQGSAKVDIKEMLEIIDGLKLPGTPAKNIVEFIALSLPNSK